MPYTWKGKEVGQSDDASDEVQFIRHFPSRKGKEVVESDAEEDYRVEDPVCSVSVDGVLALSYYIPPAHNVEHAYAFDWQVFFLVADLVLQQYVCIGEFQRLWQFAADLNWEDLLVEIIVRGDLILEDYVAAYWVIGDLGVRLLRYYREMEEVQEARSRSALQYGDHVRQPNCVDWGQAVAARLAQNWEECPIATWKSVLVEFQRDFELVGWVIQMVKDCQARLTRTQFIDVHPSEYLHIYGDVKVRLERMVGAKTFSQLMPFEIHTHANLKNKYTLAVAPEAIVGMPPGLDTWSCAAVIGVSNEYFLGKWKNLFARVSDQSDVLLWEALLWIGKDYNHEQSPLSKPIEALISAEANLRLDFGEVPPRVAENVNWCRCERKYKWRIDGQLDIVWYNWPIIPGRWNTLADCVLSFTEFWNEYKGHQDPVCFRAAIFCKALAEWCQFSKL